MKQADYKTLQIDRSTYDTMCHIKDSTGISMIAMVRQAIQIFLSNNTLISVTRKTSPSSPRRPAARVRAAKAEAPAPVPAPQYPAGLEEGVKALCRDVWKKGGPFQLDGGQTCELYSTAVDWLLKHAAETMERRNLDVEGYLAFRRSQMLAGGEAGL